MVFRIPNLWHKVHNSVCKVFIKPMGMDVGVYDTLKHKLALYLNEAQKFNNYIFLCLFKIYIYLSTLYLGYFSKMSAKFMRTEVSINWKLFKTNQMNYACNIPILSFPISIIWHILIPPQTFRNILCDFLRIMR